MNKFRGVRPFLLLGLLLGLGSLAAAAAQPPAPESVGLHAAPINPQLDLKPHQWCVLDLARDAGARIGAPKIFQAIVLQESSAGAFLVNSADPSYGAAGVELTTAQGFTAEPLTAAVLMTDTLLNLQLGSAYLAQCHAQFKAWRRTLVCYNRGAAAAAGMKQVDVDADAYVAAIDWRLQELEIYRKRASKCPRD